MASNTITRDHHNLRRNLNLNDKYISNDGGDEGLKVTDAGHTVVTGNLYIDDEGGEYISGDGTDLTVTSGGNITLDAVTTINLDSATGIFNFYDAGDTDDFFKLTVAGGTGATTLETVSDGADGELILKSDGNIVINATPISGYVEFKTCSVGFDLLTPIWGVADGDGTFTTVCAFTTGNKLSCSLNRSLGTNDDINLNFPTTSGNFTLVLIQDGTGSRTVHADAWNCLSTAGSGTVKWAGGSAPTLTTTAYKTDIISIYWDADSQTAFAVASLNF